MKPIKIREELLNRQIRIFTPEEFRRIFDIAPYQSKYFLETQVKEGLFVRLKKGLYALQTDIPSEEEIANKLYMPSYLSFEYALGYYNLIPEMPYTVTSATTKPTRLFIVNGISYRYQSIKVEAFSGYMLKKSAHASFLIAEPEKALVDYLYFVALRKSAYSERLMQNLSDKGYYKTKGLEKKVIDRYADLYEMKKLDRLVAALFS